MSGRVLFLLKGYPRLSETFIAQEIRSLERAGLAIDIVALRRPTDARAHPVHREIKAPVSYLPEYLHDEPLRVARGLAAMAKRRRFWRAAAAFLRDFARDPTRNRARRFGQAAVLASESPSAVTRIHAHFIHTPASVARYASMMTGLPWSCSAHAKDIWTTPDWDLADKLRDSGWTVTCTRAGQERLDELAPAGKGVHLVYHGLDLQRFGSIAEATTLRDGRSSDRPVRLLTVARAVEKKGLDVLLRALAALPSDLAWRWTHIGGGALTEALKQQAASLGLTDRCAFLGALDQTEVLTHYRQSDLFVLPCRIADDGDRDGLPNVLIEAASQGLASVSTPVSGVPELITHEENGLLVAPDDADAVALALARMIGDPALRHRLGKAALRRARGDFDHDAAIVELLRLFDRSPAAGTESAADDDRETPPAHAAQ
ncbi:MAG: colanic acid biosynthesis glycosyltransferase WcaL [Rhizobiales bacterium 65-9]|nr:glycosyltransferase family 4 protein [Hyphomicrobiales bacterium]OJY35479.1 MAG: colanic acid biosynthesis glycosyltransferase WcaL [Rhizobiales bacterium 65-9]